MPVAPMSKVSIVALSERKEELVGRLHEMGAVQITDAASAAAEQEEFTGLFLPFQASTRELRLAIARSEFLIELLERFEEKKGGLLAGLLARRVHMKYREFISAEEEVDLESLYRELEGNDVKLRRLKARVAEAEKEVAYLDAWKPLSFPFEQLEELETTEPRTVIIDLEQLASWDIEMEITCPFSSWEEVYREDGRSFLMVLVHRDGLADFDQLAQRFFLELAPLDIHSGTVRERMRSLEEEIRGLNVTIAGLEEGMRQALALKPRLLSLHDYLYNRLLKEEVQANFIHTELAVALEGWVETSRVEELRGALEALGEEVDFSLEEPGEDELAPTLLVNRRRIRPAESIIELFGPPSHSETDPTPFVAPFFILFFAMCIGDVGYGAILALAFWLALKKLDVSEKTRGFLRLFMYCGCATILVGIFTVGYFGIDINSLPGFLKFPGTLDILYDPVPYMIICAALGLIHISLGVAIEMYDNMRANSAWLGFCEQGTTLLLWLGLAVTAIGFGAKVDAVGRLGLYTMAAGAAGIVFLSNIGSKTIAGKFFGGLFNIYGLFASTIGDVASYLRLYALGLATIAIGSVINTIGGLVLKIPVAGILLLLLVLIGGHSFNLAINFLGAFVHPLRLQYVEFFGKFYEDGGETFAPFALSTRKIVIDDR